MTIGLTDDELSRLIGIPEWPLTTEGLQRVIANVQLKKALEEIEKRMFCVSSVKSGRHIWIGLSFKAWQRFKKELRQRQVAAGELGGGTMSECRLRFCQHWSEDWALRQGTGPGPKYCSILFWDELEKLSNANLIPEKCPWWNEYGEVKP